MVPWIFVKTTHNPIGFTAPLNAVARIRKWRGTTHFLIWSVIKVLTTLTFFISMVVVSITVVTTNFALIRFWKHCSWLSRQCFMFTRYKINVLVNVFRMDPEWRMNQTIITSRYCTSRFVLQKFQWQSTGKYTRGQNFKKYNKKQTKTDKNTWKFH